MAATMILTSCLPTSGTRESRPNVILISLDTLRQDAVTIYSGTSAPMDLGRMSVDSLIFENASTTTPFTLPAHISMLTGLHHVEHGVVSKKNTLSPMAPTLTETLSELGYETYGLYSTEWLKPEFGFGRGFDRYEMVPHQPTYADRIIQRAFEILDERTSARQPFFLFLHFYDAHSDFVSQAKSNLPYFSPPNYQAGLPAVTEDRFCTSDGSCATSFLLDADRDNIEVPLKDIALLEDLYHRGVRCLSDDLRALFSDLEQRGLYDQSLIILTSDHGEEFREHGKFLHSQVYEESVAVPLLVKLPGQHRARERVSGLVTLMEIPSMVLSLTDDDASGLAGTSADGFHFEPRETVVYQDKLWKTSWAIRHGQWKLVRDRNARTVELYDLSSDCDETLDLADAHPSVVEQLTATLEREITRLRKRAGEFHHPTDESESLLDENESERLKALGYVF